MRTVSEHWWERQANRQLLIRLREAVFDWNLRVDECIHDVDRAIEELHVAVSNRDHAVLQLENTVERIEGETAA